MSRLPIDTRRLLQDRRLVRESDAPGKLALLRRLQGRYIACNLPKEAETRVEQSFNEQLFARILGYTSLFSHAELPFHLRPKTAAGGRYDDFSLGLFDGAEQDLIVASAELKAPGCPLDKQQNRKEKLTPVEQAIRTAKLIETCRWVLVCNFRELRLYDIQDPSDPLAVVDLLEIRDRDQLAFLATHFDRDALLGSNGRGELMTYMAAEHPATPIGPVPNACRIVATFTPDSEVAGKLPSLYDGVRRVTEDDLHLVARSSDQRKEAWNRLGAPRVREGWCSIQTGEEKFAANVFGQVRYSIIVMRRDGGAQTHPTLDFLLVAAVLSSFCRCVRSIHEALWDGTGRQRTAGYISVGLREVAKWNLHLAGNDLLHPNNNTNSGFATADEITTSPVSWSVIQPAGEAIADCLGEIGLHFIYNDAGPLRFNHSALIKRINNAQQ